MSEDIGQALQDLRNAVARAVVAPAPATIRARAQRRTHRALRTVATGLLAAAAVIAVVVGMTALVRDNTATQPATPTPSPTRLVRPSLVVPPWPNKPLDDPIARVDWNTATVVLPVHPEPEAGCPSGPRPLDPTDNKYPRVVPGNPGDPLRPVFGDLTGDGRPEAILDVACLAAAESSGHGSGQLLVVTRETDGTLRGLGWAGPRGAFFPEFWVADATLYADAHPWMLDWGYAAGAVIAYQWRAGSFDSVDSGYRGIRAGVDGPVVLDLRPVAGWLGCPGDPLTLARLGSGGGSVAASVNGYVYDFSPSTLPDALPHRLDLAGDGHRYVVVPVRCWRDGAAEAESPLGKGVLVLDEVPGGFLAVDLVPVDPRHSLDGWRFAEGKLAISVHDGDATTSQVWVWNGSNFQLF